METVEGVAGEIMNKYLITIIIIGGGLYGWE